MAWLRALLAVCAMVAITAIPLARAALLPSAPFGPTALPRVGSARVLAQTTVWDAHTLGYYCFRVPSLVQSKASGAVLAFAEARRGSCDDQAPKDIVMRSGTLSASGTLAWGPTRVVVGGSSTSRTTYRNPYAVALSGTSADACPTAASSDGDAILLQFVNSTDPEVWVNLYVVSRDAGATWTAPAVSKGLPPATEGVLPGPGDAIVLGTHSTASPAPGRILSCGATGYHAGHAMESVVWSSDDCGATLVQPSGGVFPTYSECQVAELTNGSVVINMRNPHRTGCDCRAAARSDDGGVTWTPVSPQPTLIEPVCSAGFANVDGTLYFSNPASRSERVNMTLRWSMDSGATWPGELQLWDGPSAYSVAAGLVVAASSAGGQRTAGVPLVGVMYERGTSLQGPYGSIVLAVAAPQ